MTFYALNAGYYYFASAAVAVDFNRMTASSSALWSRFSPPSYFVNGHVSTMRVHGLSLATMNAGRSKAHSSKCGQYHVVG